MSLFLVFLSLLISSYCYTVLIYNVVLINRIHTIILGGFSLELGLKDVSLVQQAARQANVPMPFLSTLLDR